VRNKIDSSISNFASYLQIAHLDPCVISKTRGNADARHRKSLCCGEHAGLVRSIATRDNYDPINAIFFEQMLDSRTVPPMKGIEGTPKESNSSL
jgi:hypothetical protein